MILRSNRKYSSIYEIKKVLGVLEQKKKTKDDQNTFLDRFVAQVLHPFKTFPCTKLRDFGLYGNVEGSKTAMNWNCGSVRPFKFTHLSTPISACQTQMNRIQKQTHL